VLGDKGLHCSLGLAWLQGWPLGLCHCYVFY
jgi:hypothetical protein